MGEAMLNLFINASLQKRLSHQGILHDSTLNSATVQGFFCASHAFEVSAPATMPWARAGAAKERRQNSATYPRVVGRNPSSWQELGGPRCTFGLWLDVVGVQGLCDCSGEAQWLLSSRKLGRVQITQRISSRWCRWTAIQKKHGWLW